MAEGDDPKEPARSAGAGKGNVNDVLASIRALVAAETSSRMGEGAGVFLLTPDLRIDGDELDEGAGAGRVLTEGLEDPREAQEGAPILDEEGLRSLVNRIIREELEGELGERINRNLRKLVRRELSQMLAERDRGA